MKKSNWWKEKVGFGKYKLPRWIIIIILIADLIVADPIPVIDEIILIYLSLK